MAKKSPQKPNDLRHFAHELRNILSALYIYEQVLELSLQDKHMKDEAEIARSMAELMQKIEALLIKEIDGPGR